MTMKSMTCLDLYGAGQRRPAANDFDDDLPSRVRVFSSRGAIRQQGTGSREPVA
jgi:hypothetical protein